jgi:hypothetical protein
MLSMIDNLERLNRKERFFLIGRVLGNPNFRMDAKFRTELGSAFHLDVPEDAFVAMDYHLNWIYAAAVLTFSTPEGDRIYDNGGKFIDGTQEDVDLLVAFTDKSNTSHLIMLEAKGVTAFSNKQFRHKMDRFKIIYGDNGQLWQNQVKPYFGFISPRRPQRLLLDKCPLWLKVDNEIPWLELPIPGNRLAVFGCDEAGEPNEERAFWTIRNEMTRRVKFNSVI